MGIAGSIIATAYWYYMNVLGHDDALASEIKAIQGNKASLPDPGIRRFNDAVELIAEGKLIEGRNALYALVATFPDSNRATEAKRIIGEINMDMMFSVETNPQKKKYIVQTGDSVGLIARKQETTIECLMRANGLFNHRLHPGDHLYVFPLDFEVVVDVSEKTVTLLRNYGEKKTLFKEYLAIDVRLPTYVRAPVELVISSRAAWSAGKQVDSANPLFVSADKWLMGNRRGANGPGLNIRAVPQAKPVVPTADPKTADAAVADAIEPGVFLQREDVEELYTIIRPGTAFKITR
ncbi:LysM peptidoglycan-binding domain-containing protein [Phragmitibacter flavus]|uniref:LysM peptidoglycan-binding domain-containing protein n=1 Tax=Phragmitibacter flavus TaxID=2576071 RepID=UPI00140AEEA9|nr:LysM peptidoglycan-binding domain-containing protein [Phragmitibacter flavus]